MRSRHISKRSGRISTRSCLISLSSGRISTDQIENIDEPLLLMVNGNFSVSRRSGRLKISFSASNLPTNSPFSGSRGRDPPLIVIGVGSVGSRVGLDGLSGWVESRFCLDTLRMVYLKNKLISFNYWTWQDFIPND